MPSRYPVIRYLLCLFITACGVSSAESIAEHAPGYILVRFDDGAIEQKLGKSRNVSKASVMTALNLPAGCDIQESKFSRLQRAQAGKRVSVHDPVNLDRFVRVTVPEGMSVESFCEAMNARDDVVYAEPDGIATGGLVPNDAYFGFQWYQDNPGYTGGTLPADIQATNLWEITTGSSNVILAVMDTGLVSNNVDFAGRVVPGYNFVSDNANWRDDHYHGSTVTGCAAADGNNTQLIAGVNWNCRIMPIKVLNSSNNGTYSDMADGVAFAVSNGAKIINCSIGGGSSSTVLSNEIMSAIANDVIFVTITHNDSSGSVRFPGRMEVCITVGATETNDTWASFSNYGPSIDLCAPGRNIASIRNTGNISFGHYGTSYACPLVAGTAAIIAGIRPDITQREMETLLCASADDQVGDFRDTPGHDNYHGWGRLNAYNAVVMAMSENKIVYDPGGPNPMLSWSSPPNASNREPFFVEAWSPTGGWTTVASPGDFTYSASQTVWEATGLTGSNLWLRVKTRAHE